jgi:hypothetical protein
VMPRLFRTLALWVSDHLRLRLVFQSPRHGRRSRHQPLMHPCRSILIHLSQAQAAQWRLKPRLPHLPAVEAYLGSRACRHGCRLWRGLAMSIKALHPASHLHPQRGLLLRLRQWAYQRLPLTKRPPALQVMLIRTSSLPQRLLSLPLFCRLLTRQLLRGFDTPWRRLVLRPAWVRHGSAAAC